MAWITLMIFSFRYLISAITLFCFVVFPQFIAYSRFLRTRRWVFVCNEAPSRDQRDAVLSFLIEVSGYGGLHIWIRFLGAMIWNSEPWAAGAGVGWRGERECNLSMAQNNVSILPGWASSVLFHTAEWRAALFTSLFIFKSCMCISLRLLVCVRSRVIFILCGFKICMKAAEQICVCESMCVYEGVRQEATRGPLSAASSSSD